ncbi:hypothetical protein GCM10027037_03260 [Mucilaginibacter koreensis]
MTQFRNSSFHLSIESKTIRNSLINNIPLNDVEEILELYKSAEHIIDVVNNSLVELKPWHSSSLASIINLIDGIPNYLINTAGNPVPVWMKKFYKAIAFGAQNQFNPDGDITPLPEIEAYVDLQLALHHKDVSQLVKQLQADSNLLKVRSEDFEENLKRKFDEKNKEIETTLALLNKEVGKVAVREYADIFDNQALEHSKLRWLKTQYKISIGSFEKQLSTLNVGTAQLWLSFAISLLSALLVGFTQLDKLFNVAGQSEYTPEVAVHVLGRFLLVSLVIFIISFAFKQYRVNMHLYTLNKHRANTLKSFEYLTKAPDKLEAASYNAILMEVAKSIYEAGQTGYIATSETNNDVPSIIDMTKIITPKGN